MIDNILKKYGVGLALALLVLELTYINTKSLQYLVQGLALIDTVFGVIGAIAFSMVTVLIMRLSKRNWLKVVFPLFDIALVLCGFNLRYYDDLLGNPVRFGLTVFLALFTGLITYSLGQLNAEQHEQKASERDQKRIDELIANYHRLELKYNDAERIKNELLAKQNESTRVIERLTLKQNESARIIDDLKSKQNESERINNELTSKQIESNQIIDELTSKQNKSTQIIDELIAKQNESARIIDELLPDHILWQNFIGQKRKDKNGYEKAIEGLAQKVKRGEKVSYETFKKTISHGTYLD